MGKLVAEAMRRNPKIKPSEMLNHLRRHEGQGVIESVRDDWIEWLVSPNGRVQATPVSGLPDIMSRIREKVRKSLPSR